MTSLPVIAQTSGKGAARSQARKRRRQAGGADRRPSWVTYAILGVALLISIYPLYYTFLLASSDQLTISKTAIPSLIPGGELIANFQRILNSDIPLLKGLLNSTIVAVLQSLSVVIFSTLAGYSFAKLKFRGRGPLLVFVISTMAVPTQLGVIPLFVVMSNIGWSGKLVAVIVPGMVTAFGVFWMTQYLDDALPFELIEAARMDGCNLFRSYWHVALPASRGAGAMLFLFTFVGSWTNFFWPFIILRGDNLTLPVALQQLQASYFKDYSLIMSGVVVSVIPLLLLFILAGRQLVGGIMQGAVKG